MLQSSFRDGTCRRTKKEKKKDLHKLERWMRENTPQHDCLAHKPALHTQISSALRSRLLFRFSSWLIERFICIRLLFPFSNFSSTKRTRTKNSPPPFFVLARIFTQQIFTGRETKKRSRTSELLPLLFPTQPTQLNPNYRPACISFASSSYKFYRTIHFTHFSLTIDAQSYPSLDFSRSQHESVPEHSCVCAQSTT